MQPGLESNSGFTEYEAAMACLSAPISNQSGGSLLRTTYTQRRGAYLHVLLVHTYRVVIDKGERIFDTGMSSVQWRQKTNIIYLREAEMIPPIFSHINV